MGLQNTQLENKIDSTNANIQELTGEVQTHNKILKESNYTQYNLIDVNSEEVTLTSDKCVLTLGEVTVKDVISGEVTSVTSQVSTEVNKHERVLSRNLKINPDTENLNQDMLGDKEQKDNLEKEHKINFIQSENSESEMNDDKNVNKPLPDVEDSSSNVQFKLIHNNSNESTLVEKKCDKLMDEAKGKMNNNYNLIVDKICNRDFRNNGVKIKVGMIKKILSNLKNKQEKTECEFSVEFIKTR